MRACSIGKWSGKERRAVGGGGIFIGLSKESSCWPQIQIPDKVRGELDNFWPGRTMFGWDTMKNGGSLG
jgi:hypothetical protein